MSYVVDLPRVQRLLDVLLDEIADLERYRASISLDDLRTSRDRQHMVLHAMYVAVQSCIDVAFHVAASEGLPQAGTYQDVFLRLAEAGIIDAELGKRLAGWASFRNVLAHHYPVIDFAKVHYALSHELGDLRAFAAAIDALAKRVASS